MSRRVSLRSAVPIQIEADVVRSCIDLEDERDRRFHDAWQAPRGGATALPRGGSLPGVIGHIAESVLEVMLAERGYVPVADHPGPGRHGVDLVMMHLASELVFAIEVKGTLRAGHIPRLTRGELMQMSCPWIDKPDNPTMEGVGLASADVYGGFAALNLAEMTLRIGLSADFASFRPVRAEAGLVDPSWLVDT